MKRIVIALCLFSLPAVAQTAQEKAALDWCVREGATKWLANARSVLGSNAEGAIAAKIAKCLPLYLAASDKRPLAERQN